MKRALLLITLAVAVAVIDRPQAETVSDGATNSLEKITANYIYIYEYDGKLKTSCRTGEYDMPQAGAWYALENETFVITNARIMWNSDMSNDDITIAVYCERLKK